MWYGVSCNVANFCVVVLVYADDVCKQAHDRVKLVTLLHSLRDVGVPAYWVHVTVNWYSN